METPKEKRYFCLREQIDKTFEEALKCSCRRGEQSCFNFPTQDHFVECEVIQKYKQERKDSTEFEDPLPHRRDWFKHTGKNPSKVVYSGRKI